MSDADLIKAIDGYLDGGLDPAGFERLADRLRADPAAARQFALRSAMDRGLRQIATAAGRVGRTKDAATAGRADGAAAGGRWANGHRVMAIAAALAVVGVAAMVYFGVIAGGDPTDPDAVRGPTVATVIDARGVRFDSMPLNPGDEVIPQPIRTRGGDMELVLRSGATMKLSGPASVRLDGPMRVDLDLGWASFHCPPSAKGFTVAAPGGLRVVDLGTGFEFNATAEGDSEVWVTEGRVELITRLGERKIVDAGGGWRHDAATGRIVDAGRPDATGLAARPSMLFDQRIEGDGEPHITMGAGGWRAGDGVLVLSPAKSAGEGIACIGSDEPLKAGAAWSLELRFRVTEPHGPDGSAVIGIVVRHSDGATFAAHIDADRIVAHTGFDAAPLFAADLTDRMHTLRLVRAAGDDHAIAYLDGHPAGRPIAALRTPGQSGVWVGDTSRHLVRDGSAEVAYLRIDRDEALAPPYAASRHNVRAARVEE